jgi:hypothetical protein
LKGCWGTDQLNDITGHGIQVVPAKWMPPDVRLRIIVIATIKDLNSDQVPI